MAKIVLVIRGHIRTGFNNDKLYKFIRKITKLYDIDIYIHTWNKIQNSLSWRNLENINTVVTEQTIIDYFKDIPIKKIIIDDDSNITLIGNLNENIAASAMPTRGWKNMWYGKAAIINSIPDNSYVINTRFDYFNLESILNRNEDILLNTINEKKDRIVFAIHGPHVGVDNFYCGPIDKIRSLTNNFNENLDSILLRYTNEVHPEKIVFFEVKCDTTIISSQKNSRFGFTANTVFNPYPSTSTANYIPQEYYTNTNRYSPARLRLK